MRVKKSFFSSFRDLIFKIKKLIVFCFREDVEMMFAEKDRDNDGHLSFEEFTGQETRVERAFRAMDRDGDGYVTKTEFKVRKSNGRFWGFLKPTKNQIGRWGLK